MRKISERDMDNLASILDYCDRIISIVERFGKSFELFDNEQSSMACDLWNQKCNCPWIRHVIETGNQCKGWINVADGTGLHLISKEISLSEES